MRNDTVVRIRGDRDNVFSTGLHLPQGLDAAAAPRRPRPPPPARSCAGATTRPPPPGRRSRWDEAFAAIEAGPPRRHRAPRPRRRGASTWATRACTPSARTLFNGALIKALGTRNVFSASTVDQMPKHVSSGYLFGNPLLIPVPDLDRTDHLLMLGANPYESNGSLCTAPDFPGRLEAIQARGGKVVVVDPRRTKTAEHADEHVPIRPGTDAHLLVAMIQVLFAEDLVDLGDAGRHRRRASTSCAPRSQPFTPEAVAAVTGIDADTIRRLARELAAAPHRLRSTAASAPTPSPSAPSRRGRSTCSTSCTGNLDRPGGAMFPLPAHDRRPGSGKGRGFVTGRRRSRVSGHPEVRGEFPVAALAEEIDDAGRGPGPGPRHRGRQPGAVGPQLRPPSSRRSGSSSSWSASTPTATRPPATPT